MSKLGWGWAMSWGTCFICTPHAPGARRLYPSYVLMTGETVCTHACPLSLGDGQKWSISFRAKWKACFRLETVLSVYACVRNQQHLALRHSSTTSHLSCIFQRVQHTRYSRFLPSSLCFAASLFCAYLARACKQIYLPTRQIPPAAGSLGHASSTRAPLPPVSRRFAANILRPPRLVQTIHIFVLRTSSSNAQIPQQHGIL